MARSDTVLVCGKEPYQDMKLSPLSLEMQTTSWFDCTSILHPDARYPTPAVNRLAGRGRIEVQKEYYRQANQSILAGLELGSSQCLLYQMLWNYMAYPATS